ncbi:MAG: transcription antitermination factor NusB [Gammaproteobacteria bacterium]|jgi:N utilization substance protein B
MAHGSRERARGLLIKALYQWQLTGHDLEELMAQYSALAEFGRIDQAYFRDLLARVLSESADLDPLIAEYAARGLDQVDAVGRGILLLALAELKFRNDVPVKVVINEAVDLAKRYGAAESYRFVNAVLDKAARTLRPPADAVIG